MVLFPLLISLNSRMSLEAGGKWGGRAPFPSLALPTLPCLLPLPSGQDHRALAVVVSPVGWTGREECRDQEGCHPHACARPLLLGV